MGGAALHPLLPPSRRADRGSPRAPAGSRSRRAGRTMPRRGSSPRARRWRWSTRAARSTKGRRRCARIADAVEANAAALLVLLSRNDAGALDAFHQHGATHFLVSPFTEPQLLHALQFAQRHAERVGGGAARRAGARGEARPSPPRGAGSRARAPSSSSPALARQAGLGEEDGRRISLMELFRKLDPGRPPRRARRGRPAARDRRGDRLRPCAMRGRGRGIAHHVRVAGGEAGSSAATEAIAAPSGCRPGRDPLTGLRDGRAARAWIARAARRPGGAPALVVLLLAVSRFDAINAAFGRADRRRRAAGGGAADRAPCRRRRPPAAGRAHGRRRVRGAARPRRPRSARAASSPASWSRRSAGRSCRATMSSRSAAAPASPRRRPGDDAAALLRRASAALAEAQGADSAPVRVLEEGAESDTARGDRLEVDLRRALDQDEIEIRFQPQVSVTERRDRRRRGARPLAATRNMASSARVTLFGVAERSDYLVQLSDHVQRKAIGAAAAWPEALAGPAPVGQHHRRRHRPPRLRRRSSSTLVARERLRARAADRRGDRKRPDRGSRRRRRPARRAARRRPARRDRRFRHRLFEPRLSEGAAARLSQDRQEARARTLPARPATGSWSAA